MHAQLDAAAALRRNGSWRNLHDDYQVKTTLDRMKTAGFQRLSTASPTASRASPTTASSFSPSSGEFKVEENFDGNGNKKKKTSQKISTGDGFASSEDHFSSRYFFLSRYCS